MLDLEKLNSWEGVKVSRSIPVIRRIVEGTFPMYKGRKIKICAWKGPRKLDSYWDGGSRDYFALVDTQSGNIRVMGSNHPMFEAYKGLNGDFDLPPLHLLVERSIFLGKESGITIWVRPSDTFSLTV